MFQEVDLIVHAAYDPEATEEDGVKSTDQLRCEARRAGVRRQIFLSSLSAQRENSTAYGGQKYRLEQLFCEDGDLLVRPGLVIGRGGVFSTIERTLSRLPVFPLVDGGQSPVSYLGLNELIWCLVSLVKQAGPHREYNLFHEQKVNFRTVLEVSARKRGLRRYYLSLPSSWLLFGLSVFHRFGLVRSVKADNITGLARNASHGYPSHLSTFQLPPKSFEVCYEENLLA